MRRQGSASQGTACRPLQVYRHKRCEDGSIMGTSSKIPGVSTGPPPLPRSPQKGGKPSGIGEAGDGKLRGRIDETRRALATKAALQTLLDPDQAKKVPQVRRSIFLPPHGDTASVARLAHVHSVPHLCLPSCGSVDRQPSIPRDHKLARQTASNGTEVQKSRAEKRREKKLQGMHDQHLENRATTLQSCTASFEQDKMLYYQAIQNPAVQLDFRATLRSGHSGADDAPGRALLLEHSWRRFSDAVTSQAVRISARLRGALQLRVYRGLPRAARSSLRPAEWLLLTPLSALQTFAEQQRVHANKRWQRYHDTIFKSVRQRSSVIFGPTGAAEESAQSFLDQMRASIARSSPTMKRRGAMSALEAAEPVAATVALGAKTLRRKTQESPRMGAVARAELQRGHLPRDVCSLTFCH